MEKIIRPCINKKQTSCFSLRMGQKLLHVQESQGIRMQTSYYLLHISIENRSQQGIKPGLPIATG